MVSELPNQASKLGGGWAEIYNSVVGECVLREFVYHDDNGGPGRDRLSLLGPPTAETAPGSSRRVRHCGCGPQVLRPRARLPHLSSAANSVRRAVCRNQWRRVVTLQRR
jgi:hypothetical protein